MVELKEIIQRADQGVTQPFICRATDGEVYYVKGKNARRTDLINEYICALIGREFGVPIPPIQVIWSDATFIKTAERYFSDARILGDGSVFGSRRVTGAYEINVSDLDFVDQPVKECISVFDYWIKNGDRTLSELGGNPNLLWSVSDRQIFAIDHNLAFDDSVTPDELAEHIFIEALKDVASDPDKRTNFELRFKRCFEHLEGLIDSVPEDWLFRDADMLDPLEYDFDKLRDVLSAGWRKGFWDGF